MCQNRGVITACDAVLSVDFPTEKNGKIVCELYFSSLKFHNTGNKTTECLSPFLTFQNKGVITLCVVLPSAVLPFEKTGKKVYELYFLFLKSQTNGNSILFSYAGPFVCQKNGKKTL